MGLGRFGGGVGVTRWLASQGARVLVTDLDPREALAESIEQIVDLIDAGRITLRLGGHNPDDFTNTDLVVANPAVPRPWQNRFLRLAQDRAVPITTEIRLLIERLPRPERVIGVTGSAGKSTTCAMIAHGLRALGRGVHLGGNIGGSLLEAIPRIGPDDDVVLELSSAMLHWLSAGVGDPQAPGWSPGLAVVTNIAPNHLDWHGSQEHYETSKLQILRSQAPGGAAVLHERLRDWARGSGHVERRIAWMSPTDADGVPRLAVPGRHNRLNAAFALRAIDLFGADATRAAPAIATFPGLPHRLEFVGRFTIARPAGEGHIRAYNDSKSTTPEAAALAVDAMDDDETITAARVRLICGGYDKKAPLTPMVVAASRCAGVYTIGATGNAIAEATLGVGGRATYCRTLDRAVAVAVAEANPGDAILLSPGCASWDQFTNFEARGKAFAEAMTREAGRPSK